MNYYDIPRISNTALSCIDPETGGHPEKYRDFMDGKYRQSSVSMSQGDIIHRHLLLDESFAVIDKKPGDVLAGIIEQYYRHLSQEPSGIPVMDTDKPALLKIIRNNGYYNNRRDDTVVEGVLKEGAEYFGFLVQNSDKSVIPSEWKDILDKLSVAVLRSPMQEIFNPAEREGIEVLSEHEILFDVKGKSYLSTPEVFECKAKIDRLIIDNDRKTYRIIDLKSTSGQVETFSESVRRYKYHRQLAFYREAVSHILPSGYQDDGIYLLALETTEYCRARLFLLDELMLTMGKKDYLNQLKRVSYHNASLNWVYPMEEEANQGIYALAVT